MVLERKARLKGDEWARVWTYEAARVEREGFQLYQCAGLCNMTDAVILSKVPSSGACGLFYYHLSQLYGHIASGAMMQN